MPERPRLFSVLGIGGEGNHREARVHARDSSGSVPDHARPWADAADRVARFVPDCSEAQVSCQC